MNLSWSPLSGNTGVKQSSQTSRSYFQGKTIFGDFGIGEENTDIASLMVHEPIHGGIDTHRL
jgi:hypothetical protein